MNQDKRDELLRTAEAICKQLAELSIDERIDTINEIRRKIHEVSPLKDNPVDFIEWVKSDLVEKNDYNPNLVASPEMKALKDSIVEDGYTQPIVGWVTESKITVVDGFHRNLVGRDKKVAKKLFNRLPIANIRGDSHEYRR